MSNSLELILPDWPAPKGVFAYSTTRLGGESLPPYDSLNLGTHVGDEQEKVERNRQLLPHAEHIAWLQQVHGNRVVEATKVVEQADASFTRRQGVTCAVMTADCLPLLLCDKQGTVVAACHAGWRGLAEGVIENTVSAMGGAPAELMAWIGPAISQHHFEVQQDVVAAFAQYPESVRPSQNPGRFLVDLPAIAKTRLLKMGVQKVYSCAYCTYQRDDLFYSHRLANHQGMAHTGRFVTGIYLLPKI